MLLDIWSVLGGIGLAAVAFIVVVLVCVVILRLLAAILPSYEDRETQSTAAGEVDQGAEALDREGEAPAEGEKQAPVPDEAGPT